jgi:diguanylate cyclase (GGDEF)-like protein
MTEKMAIVTTTSEGAPTRALVLSALALLVPLVGSLVFPDWTGRGAGLLVWLLALVPAFVLSYLYGWKGAGTAFAAALAAYALAQVIVAQRATEPPSLDTVVGVMLTLAAVSVGAGALATLLRRRLDAAEDMALTDAATGLPNRRYAMLHLRRAFAAAQREAGLAVVLFDLNQLRGVASHWGHGATEDVLHAFARVLATNTRDMHLSARLDGDEFMTVLDGSDMDGATVYAQSVLMAWSDTDSPWGKPRASAGVAEYRPDMDSPNVLIAAAERALYRARSMAGGGELAVSRADDVAPVERSEDSSETPTRQGSGETILVVDDDPGVLRVLVKLLRREGYRALSASSPEKGERIVKENLGGVDLVVVDVVMPGSSGFGFVERIREGSTRAVPVLYISGYDRDEIDWDGVPGSPKAFLSKPLQMQELLTTVRQLLDHSL